MAKTNDPPKLSYNYFARIPVLHEGRIKPLDSFARIWLTSFSGKSSIEGLSAIEWLAELLFNQHKAYFRPVFNIENHDIITALSLEKRKNKNYSFAELSHAIKNNIKTISSLKKMDSSKRTTAQNQLLELNIKLLLFFEISRSVSLILPDLKINNPEVSKKLDLPLNEDLIYKDLMSALPIILRTMEKLKEKNNSNLSMAEKEILYLYQALQRFDHDKTTSVFKIIPPQWRENNDNWISPWEMLNNGQGSPQSANLLKNWQKMATAYRYSNAILWKEQSRQALTLSTQLTSSFINPDIIDMEYYYNLFNFFKYSMIFYAISLVIIISKHLLFFYLSSWHKKIERLSLVCISFGAFLHITGIAMRMFIMQRPPATTLYETIIFVGIIAVLFALIIERKEKNGIGIFAGSTVGVFLHLIGQKYAADGDTMRMLVAVLDSNFWLASHVITITIGYAGCFIAGLLAHIYLLAYAFYLQDKKVLKNTERNILAISIVALFFSTLGTILGGIWADQSWGRFWGWDPKENGALIICLWLIFLLHGRIAGKIPPFSFAVAMVITNIIVAMAWFGVNLLNVGLHSYGFTHNIIYNLALFTGLELAFIIIVILKFTKNKNTSLS